MDEILKFGKYKGYRLSQIPDDYLEWLISTQEKTLKLYRDEVERRRRIAESSMSWEMKIIHAGYRTLSLNHHPDKGGNVRDMQQLNAAHESLKSKLE